jgi:DNA-binding transcriptional ArsR family regulator
MSVSAQSSLGLSFAKRMSPANRIISALAQSGGEACLCSLRLRTGLSPNEFSDAISLLRKQHRVDLVSSPLPQGQPSQVPHKRAVLRGF